MFVSVDQDSLQRSKSFKYDMYKHGLLKACNGMMPSFLLHQDSIQTNKSLIDVQGLSYDGYYAEGAYLFEENVKKFMEQSNVNVYSREGPVDTNQFFIFGACRMQLKEKKMMIERSTVLFVETIETETKKFMTELKTKNEKITMENFKFEEFEAEGFEICDSVKFYINNCIP